MASAIAKYHTTENCRKVINDALDIHGGRGVMENGPILSAHLETAGWRTGSPHADIIHK